MPRVLITCPVTHKPLPTGLELHAVAFQLKRGARFVPCPHCQQKHCWTKASAWLEPPAPWAPRGPEDSLAGSGYRSWFLDQGPIE